MLHPHQIDGALFLTHRRSALLADDMGLGKTAQAIAASVMVGAQRIIVICPAIVCRTWADELARWRIGTPLPVTVIRSGKDPVPAGGAVVISYDLAVQRVDQLSTWGCDLLICDECHYLKNHDSQRTIAVLGKALDGAGGIAGGADRTWFLTGTPAPNHPGELFPLLRFTGQWPHGYGSFLRSFCFYKDHPTYGLRIKPECRDLQALRSLQRGVMLRRLKSDVAIDLPPITVGNVLLEPGDDCAEVLRELHEEQPHVAERIEQAIEADDWTFGGDPAVARVRRLIGLAKAGPIVKLLQNDLQGGLRKAVVFGWHRDVLRLMQERLLHAELIDGATPPFKRQEIIERFQKQDAPRVLLAQIKTAGTGLTLTTASNVLVAEPSWSPSDNLQAVMRVHRIGQKQPVLARFATLSGTIDEAVNAVLQRKAQQLAALLT